jgi:DNA-binding HxlR family transcriptional regulator
VQWYNHLASAGSTHIFVSLAVGLEGRLKKHYGCPVQGTINALSGKWKVLAIWHLGFGAKRFAQLRNLLPGVSEKVLTAQLRELETDGIVQRKVAHASPPQVTYSLTRAGEELIEPMSVLCHWGTRHLGIPPNLPRFPKTQDTGPRQAVLPESQGRRSAIKEPS